jgi:hypothetical protein
VNTSAGKPQQSRWIQLQENLSNPGEYKCRKTSAIQVNTSAGKPQQSRWIQLQENLSNLGEYNCRKTSAI